MVMTILNRVGRMNLRIFLLKTKKLSDFYKTKIYLVHSIMVDRKKRLFEKVIICV